MTIVLDAMGTDDHPYPEIQAAVESVKKYGEEIILVGDENILKPELAKITSNPNGIRIVHAPEVLEMSDKPVEYTRKKAQNSMAVGMELVKTGEAQAFVTAGNTGGAMFNALLKFGRIKGIMRPALTAIFPVQGGGHCIVLDIGANADCKPEFLFEFAIMGSVYAEKVLNIVNPRVGLLSNGEEAGKGNQLVKETYPLLAGSKLNFIGNVEGKELFGGAADVVVTDGFTGNILLKSSEAVGKLMLTTLKTELMSSTRTKIGAALAKPAFNEVRKIIDPAEVGALPLVGIDGLVFVGHGRSDAVAMVSAIGVAHHAIQVHLMEAMRERVQKEIVDQTTAVTAE
jgi:glycerol-3-phosphate acyltransferase PlsX